VLTEEPTAPDHEDVRQRMSDGPTDSKPFSVEGFSRAGRLAPVP
jgi:hypothetical protein